QTRVGGGSCGFHQGCYVVTTPVDTIAVCAVAGLRIHNERINGDSYANSCAPGHVPRRALQGVTGSECAGLCKPADVYSGSNDGASGRPNYEGGDYTETNWMTPPKPATCESAGGPGVRPEVPTTGE